ncbi:tRNA epoxyqueuosine(34) reductase QueG [Ectobacillus sp. sgz5001026]|uniref:tRNA epoxyqueuosine(34) reductase QueG n=1 Tax=Ectobacillus sp. sgz5001026 TaxID=3242473 RepID=UPI0036D2177E
MNVEDLKQELIRYSKEIGIDTIGFASAAPFTELKQRLIRQQELGYASGFEESDIEKRTEPEKLLQGAQSIIAIGLAYPSKLSHAPRSKKGAYRGMFSRASWGQDYHTVLRKRLVQIEEFLRQRVPDLRFSSMVDTGELSDRAVAERAGIGWSGKNCAIISPKFGTYLYLAEIITNIPFFPDTPLEDGCGSCNKCVEACPTGALVQGGQLNSQRCISFLTQTKDFVPDEFRSIIGNRLYGCDTCQTVCPKNKGVDYHHHPDMEPNPNLVKPLLKPLLSISNKEFKETYGSMSGSWRGKKPIQRNAIFALAHFKDVTAIPDLLRVMREDPRPVMRGSAAWALGKIGNRDVLPDLEEAKGKEKDEQVRAEMDKGMQMLML